MTPTQFASTEMDRFRAAIAGVFGLHFDEGKQAFLAEVLRRRLAATHLSSDRYLEALKRDGGVAEAAALAPLLTVGETFFFRHAEQYRAFAEVALPDRLRAQGGTRRLQVLSAGCASGEEAYSLGMIVAGAIDATWDASVLGVDVNPVMIDKASRGRYTAWSLRDTPDEMRQRWFTAEGRDFTIDPRLRRWVRFEVRNLFDPNPALWAAASYDVVFFRNVMMYFTLEHQQAVIARIERALKPGGYLFLGHAETLRGLTTGFHLHHTHGTFYYQRKDCVDAVPDRSEVHAGVQVPAMAAAIDNTASWVAAIHDASERIARLAGPRPRAAAARARQVPADRARWDLDATRDLLRDERFGDALDAIGQLPPQSANDPEVLLLRAALLTHRGQLIDAEAACRRLLTVDEANAGAHYLLALCRESAQDRAGAVHHDQLAMYLDPGFAMPHVHLGLMARRAGDGETADRELRRAIALLQREDGSRLLLFGGGFGREALIALCRTELASLGGAA